MKKTLTYHELLEQIRQDFTQWIGEQHVVNPNWWDKQARWKSYEGEQAMIAQSLRVELSDEEVTAIFMSYPALWSATFAPRVGYATIYDLMRDLLVEAVSREVSNIWYEALNGKRPHKEFRELEYNDGRYYRMELYRVLELLELGYDMLKGREIEEQIDREGDIERIYDAVVMIKGLEGA